MAVVRQNQPGDTHFILHSPTTGFRRGCFPYWLVLMDPNAINVGAECHCPLARQLHRFTQRLGYFPAGSKEMGKLDSVASGRYNIYSSLHFSRQTLDSRALCHVFGACLHRPAFVVSSAGVNFYPYFCEEGEGKLARSGFSNNKIIWDVHLVVPNRGAAARLPVAKATVPAAHQGAMP